MRTEAKPQAPTMCDMVSWYDPRQLARTAIDVAVSTIFGRHADFRLIEALTPTVDQTDYPDDAPKDLQEEPDGFFDHSNHEELWIDYVADTGDGWDSTYSIAYLVAQTRLDLKSCGADGKEASHATERGAILIFGGDEVYPVASRKAYHERLIQPYEAALGSTPPPHPRVFAIPGNHDWYDSLVSFTRLYCSRRWFAGWQTRQTRSYFALKLPHGWWLIGTDVQLDSDVDEPQVRYFRGVAKEMQAGDRIILCTAEPHWIYAKIYNKYDSEINENNLAFLERKVFEKKVSVYVSGDLHHYRRHATDDGLQKITAGGGGAFLHPTHGEDVTELAEGYRLRQSFPSVQESKKLTWKNLLFLFLNPWFGLITGFLYMLTAWSVMADIGSIGLGNIFLALRVTISTALINPAAVFWILLVWAGFLFFTDTHSQRYRVIAGSLHGLAHVLCTFFIGWGATYVGVSCFGFAFKQPKQLLLAAAIIFVLGWIVGSIVMGLYLLISLNIFGRHSNEAFSALACPDWKNFLRLKIETDGSLKIFPVGIRKVSRKWSISDKEVPSILPGPDGSQPELIEPPIVLPASRQPRLESIAMSLQARIEQVIDDWCSAEAGSYDADTALKSLWMRIHPVSPPYESSGAPQLLGKIHSTFADCPAALEISIGYFVTGGAIQKVQDLYEFLNPCDK
jgi:hypothetical protein